MQTIPAIYRTGSRWVHNRHKLMMHQLRQVERYLRLTKPGIIAGNLVATLGGYFLAAQGNLDRRLLLATVAGVCLVIASGCVFNNYIDRDIDGLMQRTRTRALVTGSLPTATSLVFASLLGLAGISLLYLETNALATALAVFGFIIYVGVYSLYLKRRSVHATLVGSLAGATPPVIGYCAVSQQFDLGAALLLVIFSLWQMPHAFAIAVFRLNDYRAAAIPVLPVKRGIKATKHQIFFYVLLFLLVTPLLSLTGYTGRWFAWISGALGCYWLYLSWSGFSAENDAVWARRLFSFSIVTVSVVSLMMALDTLNTLNTLNTSG